MYILEVVGGPLDGKTWSFEREITIGRDDSLAGACITLDRYVSRRHAHLREGNDGSFVLTDLSSTNGTLVGDRVAGSETPIGLGDPFKVGRTFLRVNRPQPGA